MRDVALSIAIFAVLGVTAFQPFAGLILWTWFAVQNPHEEAYGFTHELPLNLIIAVVTVFAWMVSRERKVPPLQFVVVAIFVFLAWTTFNSFFAFSPEWSWPYWNRTWKIFALGLLIATLATDRVRIHAILWTIVLSLFYYGVKGGIFTILTLGKYHVFGPPDSIIGDNNHLAVALLMALPLANYLRNESANRWISACLLIGMVLSLIAVLGSDSRGGLITLGVLGVGGFATARRRTVYIIFAAVAAIAVLNLMPQSYWQRASTIATASMDQSFQDRLMSWQVSYRYAVDHFPLGAGFYGPQLAPIYNSYFPHAEPHAAHSIFFQVLGEHGFLGLIIYVTIIVAAFGRCSAIAKYSRRYPGAEWSGKLARMIQLSLLVFCVGGSALSMAYYDVFVILVALLVPISELTVSQERTQLRSGSFRFGFLPADAATKARLPDPQMRFRQR